MDMKIIVGISGASGAILGVRVLEELRKQEVETHLVISRWGLEALKAETQHTCETLRGLATCSYDERDLAAPIASGSFPVDGMLVVPCSMKSLAGIACGYADSLLLRAADVTIKEKRKLLLAVREAPLSAIHLENMLKLARLGVIIFPPVPAFYTRAESIDDLVSQSVGRILDHFGIGIAGLSRWGQQ
jgi:4-hydroxy-3-polyprenylbenzoate decarboxylase